MPTRAESPVGAFDEARHQLCHRLAIVLREGQTGLQIRFVQTGQSEPQLWIYTLQQHSWTKRDDLVIADELRSSLQELLEGLFRPEFADEWTCHRSEHSDRLEFELKFSRDRITPHLHGDLESYLIGCLSHAHHDSGQDSRRRMGFRGQR